MRHRDALSGPVTVSEMKVAESVIIKYVGLQGQAYPDELKMLGQTKHVARSSRLVKLSPTLEEGILVVGGRLKHLSLSQRSKCPIILPYGHTLSQMIVLSYHNDAHLGTEWVLSKIRCKFWIVNARKLVKKIKRQCVTCKRLYAAPLGQRMADLPPERCQPGNAIHLCRA